MKMEERIIESYFNLLEKNSVKNITVDTIIKNAGISRSSFYRCFSSKEDILYSSFSLIPKKAVVVSGGKTYMEMLVDYYETLATNKKQFQKILHSDLKHDFMQSVYRYNYDYFSSALHYSHRTNDISDAAMAYMCSGLTTVTTMWLDNQLKLNPQQAGKENYFLIPERVREVVEHQAGWLEYHILRNNSQTDSFLNISKL